jgi:hypothetical protein
MRVRQQYGQNAHSRREEAWMSVLTSGHLGYHSGPAAGELLREWKRVVVDFDIDDETRKPRAVHLTQAPAGRGYKVRLPDGQRQPWLPIPTSAVGRAAPSEPRVVEETVSKNEIVVSIPFEF